MINSLTSFLLGILLVILFRYIYEQPVIVKKIK